MNVDLWSMIAAAALAAFAVLVIYIKKIKNKNNKLQKERDVGVIKKETHADVANAKLNDLVGKLNRKVAESKRDH